MVVLGIDFGTTNSCISLYHKNIFEIIPNNEGNLSTPSVIYMNPESEEILYGDSALYFKEKNSNCFSNLKRLIGKNEIEKDLRDFFKHNNFIENKESEIIFNIKYNKKDVYLSVQDLIILYIKHLKNFACGFLNLEITLCIDIVITIPVYYNESQRTIIKHCCEEAGFNVLRIINEPTAASLAYAYDRNLIKDIDEEYVLVFDCGGGTTDLSLIHMDYKEQLYKVEDVIGNNLLGGEDITKILVDYLMQPSFKYNGSILQLRKACEKLKREISFKENAFLCIELGESNFTFTLSKSKFIDILKPFFIKIDEMISNLLNANEHIIKTVVFVGGSSRIPFFSTIFQNFLGDIFIHSNLNPDQAVSIGASVQGALIENLFDESDPFSECLLLDIIPLSIGIETLGGIMAPIISKNSTIPISRMREFTNSEEDESEIEIKIYQGERKLIKDNFFLSSFILSGIPQAKKNTIIIQVTFSVDNNSIITVSAKIKGDINSNKIIITKNYKKDNIKDILLEADENKLYDSEISQKIINKIELYDIFKNLLFIFHENRKKILGDLKENENFTFIQLNILFNKTFDIINNFEKFSLLELKNIKIDFPEQFNLLLYSSSLFNLD